MVEVVICGRVLADVARALPRTDDELARVAARDLGRLYGLLRRELAHVRLSEAEVGVVEAAWGRCSPSAVSTDRVPSLADATALAATRCVLVNGADVAGVLATLRSLSPVQTLAVLDACERLRRADDRNDDAARRRILAQFGEPDAPPDAVPASPLLDGSATTDPVGEVALVTPTAGRTVPTRGHRRR